MENRPLHHRVRQLRRRRIGRLHDRVIPAIPDGERLHRHRIRKPRRRVLPGNSGDLNSHCRPLHERTPCTGRNAQCQHALVHPPPPSPRRRQITDTTAAPSRKIARHLHGRASHFFSGSAGGGGAPSGHTAQTTKFCTSRSATVGSYPRTPETVVPSNPVLMSKSAITTAPFPTFITCIPRPGPASPR